MMYVVKFRGHPNVRSAHLTTTEITTSPDLTVRGDCIVGVAASSGCAGLPEDIKRGLQNPCSRIKIIISVGTQEFVITGRGSQKMELSHQHDMVIRKSGFVCSRTLAIHCNAASADMPRGMVQQLQKGASGSLCIMILPGHGSPHPQQ